MVSEDNRIAIIIPVYNESVAISKLLYNLDKFILNSHDNVDVFVFEDGSTDGTKEILEKILNTGDISRLFVNVTPERKGYPKAVKDAIMSINLIKYHFILFMDGDGQYSIKDILKILSYANNNFAYDMVVGRRKERVESILRKFLTLNLKILEYILFKPAIKDVTSALRLMKSKTAQDITSKVKYSKYNFWLEFTARMSTVNLFILELPVDYIQREEGDSQVYSIKKIPKIVFEEFKAVFLTFLEINAKKLFKFALVGATGALIILFSTWILTEFFNLFYLASAAISIEMSIVWAFALNTLFTFKYKFSNYKNYLEALAKYHLTALGGMMINLVFLFLLTEYIHLFYLISEIFGIIAGFGFNYLVSTAYVWQNPYIDELN